MLLKTLVSRSLLHNTPYVARGMRVTRREVKCKSNQVMVDIIIGIIVIGVVSDVGSTLMKKKWQKLNAEKQREVIEPIVMDEDDEKSEAEKVIDVELE